MKSSTDKINLYNFSREQLTAWLNENGHSAFRAKQIFTWLYHHRINAFSEMKNIGHSLIDFFEASASLDLPEIHYAHQSNDGTIKFIFKLYDGNAIETVFIPNDRRGTLCLSSQVGCALKCTFCLTGQAGFNRNLHTHEIIGQYIQVRNYLHKKENNKKISNIVFMGMGEPLLNEQSVFESCSVFMDDLGAGLSMRRVTVSSSGVIPAIERMKNTTDASLTISLHAPNDVLRNILVPLNKKYPLQKLIQQCKAFYSRQKNRKISFAYVMLKDINDTKQHALELIDLLKDFPCKVNLIPFNVIPNVNYKCSGLQQIRKFQKVLAEANITTTIRTTRGDDVTGACGQLKGEVKKRVRKSQKAH